MKKEYRYALLILLGTFVIWSLISCNKDEIDTTSGTLTKLGGCVPTAAQKTDWFFPVGDGFVLLHTFGLEQMALWGNTSPLNTELCELGKFDKRIPSGLKDDPEGDGYAAQIVFGDYIIAMYHPETYKDHFITYNHENGSWIRWVLGTRPSKFRTSEDE